jgi:general secretion pathway protein H
MLRLASTAAPYRSICVARPVAATGFTLIEVLVVILIIGLGIGIVSFTIDGNRPQVLRGEARELANQIAIVAAESTLGDEPWGLEFYRGNDAEAGEDFVAWRWMKFRELTATRETEPPGWQPAAPSDLAASGRFDAAVEAVLEIEGIDVPIEALEENAARDEDEAPLQPDIWLAPGGEMTPFVLHLRFAGDRYGPYIRGDALGRIELEASDESP